MEEIKFYGHLTIDSEKFSKFSWSTGNGFLLFGSCSSRVIDGWVYIWVDGSEEPYILESTMPLEKIPAILLVGYGIHISVTVPRPWTPKNQRYTEDAVQVNWLVIVFQVSNFGASQKCQPTDLHQGRILDVCNHRTLHHCGGNNEGHLVKGSCDYLVAKR